MIRPLLRPAAFWGTLLGLVVAHAQSSFSESVSARSFSGQFIVSRQLGGSAPLLPRADLAANSGLVRLEPALLTVSAERFKAALWDQLGLKPEAGWRGKILIDLQPARTTNDVVTIAASQFLRVWNYRVAMPEVVTRTRFSRALSAVLLLEIANRETPAPGRSAEIPAWLVDGLACQTLATSRGNMILSAPAKKNYKWVEATERGLDPLAGARPILQNSTALTFDQMSWPADAQMDGEDGGAYLASAQLFVHELLTLNNGADKCRRLLAQLPGCLNWQTAFFSAFREDFRSPVEVEKWWALQVVAFAAHDPGPGWPLADSRERLAGLLSVPVEYRSDSNALPTRAEIPFQAALRNFTREQQADVLAIKLRDLALAQFRLAQPFAGLAGSYRLVLADYFGERKKPSAASQKATAIGRQVSLPTTLKKLDALDARRRELDARVRSEALPQNRNRTGP